MDEEPTRAPRIRLLKLLKESKRAPGSTGLCLSGGGYRAMLFHLGSLWRLNDTGLMAKLTRVAGVSGGAITAAVLGQAWNRLDFNSAGVATRFEELVVEPLLQLANKTIDWPAVLLGPFIGGAANWTTAAYERILFKGKLLQDLPDPKYGPLFEICATNLANGKLWRFTHEGMLDGYTPKIHDHTFPLAKAVAASAAFPPFLSPLRIKDSSKHSNKASPRKFWLTDGGVYDNLGIEHVLRACETIFASDGNGPYPIKDPPPIDWIFGTRRVVDNIHYVAGKFRQGLLIDLREAGYRKGCIWAIHTSSGMLTKQAAGLPVREEAGKALALTPTRLKRLAKQRQYALINWGYAAADQALRAWFDSSLPLPKGFPLPGGVATS